MGKGDRRSRKGKIWRHSFGVSRKRKTKKRPAFVPKAKKEKKISAPQVEAVEAAAVEATAESKAKKAPAKKKAAGEKAPAKKKASKKE